MNTLDKILKILALVSIEPIIFANMFFGQMAELWLVYFIFCSPILLILVSVFRPYQIWLGNFWAYFSAIFILLPIGLSSMVTEKFYPTYHEYRIWTWLIMILIATYLIKKFAKTQSDKKEEANDYFKIRFIKRKHQEKIDAITDIIQQRGYESFAKNIDMDKFALVINLFNKDIQINIYNSFNDRTKSWFKKKVKDAEKTVLTDDKIEEIFDNILLMVEELRN